MGTRADFYIGRGEQAEWIGSIAWDGDPRGITAYEDADCKAHKTLAASSEDDFRQGVKELGSSRSDFTDPAERGWPWPWDTSAMTNYAYAYDTDDGIVYGSGFGHPWFEVNLDDVNGGEPLDEDGNEIEVPTTPAPVFPNMQERKEVRYDVGSGALIVWR